MERIGAIYDGPGAGMLPDCAMHTVVAVIKNASMMIDRIIRLFYCALNPVFSNLKPTCNTSGKGLIRIFCSMMTW